jgi:hypothetical protein
MVALRYFQFVARKVFGQSVVRKEDDPPLRGRGRYFGDSAPRGTL